MPKSSLILNYSNNSIQFHPAYLPDGEARPLWGNAPTCTQNLTLHIWVEIINSPRPIPPPPPRRIPLHHLYISCGRIPLVPGPNVVSAYEKFDCTTVPQFLKIRPSNLFCPLILTFARFISAVNVKLTKLRTKLNKVVFLKTFVNCSCIPSDDGYGGKGKVGFCEADCKNWLEFLVMVSIFSLVTFAQLSPSKVVVLRFVKENLKCC